MYEWFWWGKLKERVHLEEPDIDNIKMDLQEDGLRGMDWIYLVQVKDRWRALVIALMNFRVL